MKTPPKDGTMIFGSFRGCYPVLLACMWNVASQEWVVAVPKIEGYDGIYNDHYFENEYFAEEEMEDWRSII